jgi:hypothetical protein
VYTLKNVLLLHLPQNANAKHVGRIAFVAGVTSMIYFKRRSLLHFANAIGEKIAKT